MKTDKGITLIALVITIVVLIILATVSINMILSDEGIIGGAEKAKDLTRASSVKEEIDIWRSTKTVGKYVEGTSKAFGQLIEELFAKGLLTREEADALKAGESITIGEVVIEAQNVITLGSIYKDEMIGQKISYSANGQNDWIVFGKDENGKILITTAVPVADGFNLGGGALAWLTYEDDLQQACAPYGGTVQGKNVTARSIKQKDLQGVMGIEMNFEGGEVSFGTTEDWGGHTNSFYPSLEAESNGYWKKPEADGEFIIHDTCTSGYKYQYLDGNCEFNAKDTWISTDLNEDRFALIWGDEPGGNMFETYLLADKGFGAYNPNNCHNYFVGSVVSTVANDIKQGSARSLGILLGSADDTTYTNNEAVGLCDIRPIVELPATLEVEEKDGVYDLVN